MLLWESVVWSLARSVLIASSAIWPLLAVLRQIESCAGIRSRQRWIFLAVSPFFVPELLTGFNYRLTATQLTSGFSPVIAAAGTELLYGLLQFARCLATGVAVSLLLPQCEPAPQSLHTWDMLKGSILPRLWLQGWLVLRLDGPWGRIMISWSIMALFVFQEFETAALMQIDRCPVAWTVLLFDAHAARQPLADSLQMIAWPLLCEVLLLVPACVVLIRFRRVTADCNTMADLTAAADARSVRTSLVALMCLLPAMVMLMLWPAVANSQSAAKGFTAMIAQPSLLKQPLSQILTSTVFSAAATLLVMQLASGLLSQKQRSRWNIWPLLVVLPGLFGSLVLSLLFLQLFQWPVLHLLYDTWLPLLLGQSLAVMPKAMAIVLLLRRIDDRSANHSAKLLLASPQSPIRRQASSILWRLSHFRWLIGSLMIAYWCFWDVTVASILRPVQWEPVVTRLYNEMHYGRTEALVSLSLLALVMPLAVWGISGVVLRIMLLLPNFPFAKSV